MDYLEVPPMDISPITSSLTSAHTSGLYGFRLGGATRAKANEAFGRVVLEKLAAGKSEAGHTGAEQSPKEKTPLAGKAAELATSLSKAASWLEERFGAGVRGAFVGRVLGAAANAKGDESAFAEGLLDAVRVVDKRFGFEAGDQVMAFFNEDLNKAVNGYFDNGVNEVFFAVQAKPEALVLSLKKTAPNLTDAEATNLVDALLAELKRGGRGRKGVKDLLDVMDGKLSEAGLDEPLADAASGLFAGLFPGPAAGAVQPPSRSGVMLDLVV